MNERLDRVEGRITEDLIVGKTYKLGIAHGSWFSHYEIARISGKTVHSEYSVSYACHYAGNTFGYRWDQPHWGSVGQSSRIVTAEITEDNK